MSSQGDLRETYDARYAGDYRAQLSGYEKARWKALEHFIKNRLRNRRDLAVLDYGCGSGLYVELWERLFPDSRLSFCDISPVAGEKLATKYPKHRMAFGLVENQRASFSDNTFDVIVSVEVMEHVEHLDLYLTDIFRLLKPGGAFVWTTPCGNELSIEHVYAWLTGQVEPTQEGFRRWRWEDPTHLRRLKSREIAHLLGIQGFVNTEFRFRAHLFSFLCTYCPPRARFGRLRDRVMAWDYRWFRALPNGASMLGCARKPLKRS